MMKPKSPYKPSSPWGKSMTRPVWRPHFVSPEQMNVSIIICALLEKSPNWASQITKLYGLTMLKPSSNPSTPNSDKELLHTVYKPPSRTLQGNKYVCLHGYINWTSRFSLFGECNLYNNMLYSSYYYMFVKANNSKNHIICSSQCGTYKKYNLIIYNWIGN